MDEDLPTQVTNGPDMDPGMGGDLHHADPEVLGHPEPNELSGEKVRSCKCVATNTVLKLARLSVSSCQTQTRVSLRAFDWAVD